MRYYDIEADAQVLTSQLLGRQDCALMVADHNLLDWTLVGSFSYLVVDSLNPMARVGESRARVVSA